MALLALVSARVNGQHFCYTADAPPQEVGWDISQIVCGPDLWTADGWFYQRVELCPGFPPPGGQSASYRRVISDMLGVRNTFFEWRVTTDAPRSEIPWGGGAAYVIANTIGVRYTFFIAADQVKLNRDNALPIIFIELEPNAEHTFRLEQYGADLYTWFIDGQLVDFGVPEGPLTCCTPEVVWRAKASWVSSTTRWDYIRYGALRETAPGDANCDGAINLFDIDPFVMALFDPVAFNTATPDCSLRSADLNGDLHVNFFDIDPFVECLFGACP